MTSDRTGTQPGSRQSAVRAREFVIGLISFLTLIDLFGSQALLPTLTQKFGTDPGSMGFAVNASTIGMVAAGIVVALASRHLPRKSGIWISLALLSIPTALLGITNDLTMFTVLRVIQGIFMSTAFTLTMAYLAEECSAKESATAMAAYITGNVASNLFGRLIAATSADFVGLSESFFLFAMLNIAGAVVTLLCLGRTEPRLAQQADLSPFAIWAIHLRNGALQASFVIGFLILFAFIGVFTYVNYVLAADPFALSPVKLGLVYFVFVPSIFTTPLAGRLAQTIGIRRAFWLSMSVAGLGLMAVLSTNLLLVLAGLAAIGVGTFCAQAVATGLVGRAATADRAAASGIYLASYYLGGLLGSLVLGKIYNTLGWTGCVSGVAAAIAISCLFAIRLTEPRSADVAAQNA